MSLMKLSTHTLLPVLLLFCTMPSLTMAASAPHKNTKSEFSTMAPVVNTPIFPVVKSTDMVAIIATTFSSPGPAISTVSGIISAHTNSATGKKFYIESDSTSIIVKTFASSTLLAVSKAYNAAVTNLINYNTGIADRTLSSSKSTYDPLTRTTTAIPLDATLNGTTITPGRVYYNANLTITGTNTFTNPDLIYIITVGGNLTISSSAKFAMQNGKSFKNVYFRVAGTTTIGDKVFAPAQFISAGKIKAGAGTVTGILCSYDAVTLGSGTAVNTMFDTDGDGIEDDSDHYPNDASRATDSPIPSQTLAFEDLWPHTGDFDMNDLVMSCDYNLVSNGAGLVTEITGNYHLLASGGVLHNGFGVEFPMNSSDIKICPAATPFAKIGTQESGQKLAVITFFTDMRHEMTEWNTLNTGFSSPSTLYTVSFRLLKPVALKTLTLNSFNPFLFRTTSGSRTEVHLPGKQPTTLADKLLFGKFDDASILNTPYTYMTQKRLPFAIMIPSSDSRFPYPAETKDISKAFLKFEAWASSASSLQPVFTDWFSNTTNPSYRNNSNIYVEPVQKP